ncbi:MAG: hypothetical protein QG620_934 [Patescibacteria group bacterium]|nr:hypothetical protein [Patescibacteria group bacterium]
MTIAINKYIVANPSVCHGKPVFKGTRVMVWQVLEMLSADKTPADVLRAFPTLTKKHISAALNYASSLTQKNYVIINTFSQTAA